MKLLYYGLMVAAVGASQALVDALRAGSLPVPPEWQVLVPVLVAALMAGIGDLSRRLAERGGPDAPPA